MISLKDSARCLGLFGSFSILRDYFGYASIPNSLSLSRQLKLLRDGQHVVIHIKIIDNPTNFTIDEMVEAMRQVYGNSGIGVIFKSRENLNVLPDLLDIDVGPCNSGQTMTDEQNQLFGNKNNVGTDEIVIYFVRTVLQNNATTLNGCASHPNGMPGVIISNFASRWTLGHETGHVLGLAHVESPCPRDQTPPTTVGCLLGRIMTCCGTGSIPTGTVPTFDSEEVQTILNSTLSKNC